MEPLMNLLQAALILIVGLAVRFAILLVGLAMIVVPILAMIAAARAARGVWRLAASDRRAGVFGWRRHLYYAPNHLWLKEERDSTVRIGMDRLAQQVLDGVNAVWVARPGSTVREGDVLATFEAGTRRVELATPTDGIVVAANADVVEDPDLIHRDPYRRGWLAVVAPSTRQYSTFRSGQLAKHWLENESQRFGRFLEAALGTVAADGGELVTPPVRLLREEQWESATREFLHATVTSRT